VTDEEQLAALDRLLEAFPADDLIHGDIEIRPDGAWTVFDVKPANSAEYVLAHWRGLVTCGVLAAMSRERGWTEVCGKSFALVREGRRRIDSESVLGELQEVEGASEQEVRDVLTKSAAEAHARLDSVHLADLNGYLAPEITVVASDPRLVKELLVTPLMRGRMVEGAFVLVHSEDGAAVDTFGYGVRVPGGVGFADPTSSFFGTPA
jgi:hypothetical protein